MIAQVYETNPIMPGLEFWHAKIVKDIRDTREALETVVEEGHRKRLSCRLYGLYQKLGNLEARIVKN
jgi:hypothetical protein